MRRPITVTVIAVFYGLSVPSYLWDAIGGADARSRLLYPIAMAALAAAAAPGLWKMRRWGWGAGVALESLRLLDVVRTGVARVVTGEWPQFSPEQLRKVAAQAPFALDIDAAVWLGGIVITSGATCVLTYLSVQRPLFWPVEASLVVDKPSA